MAHINIVGQIICDASASKIRGESRVTVCASERLSLDNAAARNTRVNIVLSALARLDRTSAYQCTDITFGL